MPQTTVAMVPAMRVLSLVDAALHARAAEVILEVIAFSVSSFTFSH